MSFSPQKQSSEDVSPGIRTPIDRSPEASIATPLHGERAGAKKRPRLSGDDDARAELTLGEERVASTSVRKIAAEIRVDALKQQARTLSAELAGAILEARRSRYGEKMRREGVGRAVAPGLSRLNRARIENGDRNGNSVLTNLSETQRGQRRILRRERSSPGVDCRG